MRFQRTARLAFFFGRLMVKRWLLPDLDVRPLVAELFVTDNCNLRCVSCACWRGQTENELTREEWYDVIRQLGDLGFVKLNFTGGEALLRRDIEDIVRFASGNSDAELHLNTNAIFLTPPKARRLIDAGIRSFNISIDGATPQMHDGIRGLDGAFERTVENLQALAGLRDQHKLKLRMCFTVMRKNIHQLVEMAQLSQRLQVGLFFNVLTDHTFLFRGHQIVQLGEIDHGDLDNALNELLVFKRKRPEFLPRYSVINYIGEHFRDQLQKELPCVEASLKLWVHSQGQVGGCWAHDAEFSVRQEPIAAIMSKASYRRTQTDLYFKRCKGCGANHSLNLRFEPRAVALDALWQMGIVKKRRKTFA